MTIPAHRNRTEIGDRHLRPTYHEPGRILLVWVCKIDAGRDMQSLVAMSFSFLAMGKKWRGRFAPPIGAG